MHVVSGNTDLLLKMNGLRKCNRLPWAEIADIYEAEAGERVEPERLRKRVVAAVRRNTRRLVMEATMKLDELGTVDCAGAADTAPNKPRKPGKSPFRKFAEWLKSLFSRKGGQVRLEWAYGNCNGANAVEDTSPTGYKLTKFTFDGKTVRFDGVGAMWGYDHAHHDARNCLFLRDGDKYVGGFFEWGDPSRKSREIKNITSKYGGWDPARLASAKEFAFCITDKAGKRRTNVLTFRR